MGKRSETAFGLLFNVDVLTPICGRIVFYAELLFRLTLKRVEATFVPPPSSRAFSRAAEGSCSALALRARTHISRYTTCSAGIFKIDFATDAQASSMVNIYCYKNTAVHGVGSCFGEDRGC